LGHTDFPGCNSEINAFNPVTGMFEGTIPINVGSGNTPGGLWALDFGIGGNNGSPNTLYFTDGINQQADGLFGAISVAPANTVGNVMTAGKGTDTFNFEPASIGNNTINNFNPSQDTIVFNDALLLNYAAVLGATKQVGPDTVIKPDANDSVTLTNTLASSLTSNNQEANRALFEEQVDIIFKAFNNERFSHKGKFYTLPPEVPYRGYTLKELTLVPRPFNLPVECWQPIQSGSMRALEFMAKHGIQGMVGGGSAEGGAMHKVVIDWQTAHAKLGKPIDLGERLCFGFHFYMADSREG
jgi:hypothetical protein